MFTQLATQMTRYYKESKDLWTSKRTQVENLNSFLVSKFMAKIHYTESLGEFPIRRVSICIVYGNFSTKFILSMKPLHLNIYILCLFVHWGVCLFVSNELSKWMNRSGQLFFVGPRVTPGKVCKWSPFNEFASNKI